MDNVIYAVKDGRRSQDGLRHSVGHRCAVEQKATGGGRVAVGQSRRYAAGRVDPQNRMIALALGLMALLVLCSGIALAEDGEETSNEGGAALSAPPEAPSGPELFSERTATSETYLLPDGGRETLVYETPINYRDENGDWQPIEEGFDEASGPGVVNGENRFDVKLPEQLGSGAVRLSIGDLWVAQRLIGEQSDPVKIGTDDVATYGGEQSGTTFELSTLGNGLKEEIEIDNLSQPSSFEFELTASAGLEAALAEDGSVEFRDGSDRMVVSLPAPTVLDASAEAGPVHYELQNLGAGRWQLLVEVDQDWLAQSDRAWPTRIDPTLELLSPALDCMFGGKPGEAGWRVCGSEGRKELFARYVQEQEASKDYWARSALRFNLTAIPTSAYVAEATIGVHASSEARNTSGAELRPMYITNPWTSKLNWQTYDGVNKWQSSLEGGAWYLSGGADILTANRGAKAGWWTFSNYDRAWVQNWVSQPSKNTGLILKLKDDKVRDCTPTSCKERFINFDSSAIPDTSKRPYMKVKWYAPAPSTSTVTSPGQGAQTARRVKLESGWSVAGVTGVTYQYRPTPLGGPGPWETIPPSVIADAKGQQVNWPLAVEGKSSRPLYFDAERAPQLASSSGGVYGEMQKFQVRALFEGPIGVAGYSVPVNVVLDPEVGNARDAKVALGPGEVDLMTGNFMISETDVSIPTPLGPLEFGRSNGSRARSAGVTGVLGSGWMPSIPVHVNGSSDWRTAKEVTIGGGSYEEEGELVVEPSVTYMVLTDRKGLQLPFELSGSNFVAPPELTGWTLTRLSPTLISLSDPTGTRTSFEKNSAGTEYLPVTVTPPGAEGSKTQMIYQLVNGAKRLKMVIAPSAVTCTEANATTQLGCRSLTFTYEPATKWGAPAGYKDRLYRITYHGPSTGQSMFSPVVSEYAYNSDGQLIWQRDPRISLEAKTTYTYIEKTGPVKTVTSPGEEPWTMAYETRFEEEPPDPWWPKWNADYNALRSVSRPSLVSSSPTAQTTIVYDVPVSGSSGPYDLSPTAVAKWGQKSIPTDATAIFAPDEVPSTDPPSSYTRATVYYMDAEGQLVNTANPSGAGTSAATISTTERDEFGNIVRELGAQNRLRALAASDSVKRAEELATKRLYNSDGTELLEEWGPLHQARLKSGASVDARFHRTVQYNKDAPAPPAGFAPYHLPTRETTGASIPGQGEDADQQVTETKYNWTFRKPYEVIADPLGLNLRTFTRYDIDTGHPVEVRLPKGASSGDQYGHTSRITYYSANASAEDPACRSNPAWAYLPCKVHQMKQPGTASQPALPVKRVMAYGMYGLPLEIREGAADAAPYRLTTSTYDAAGRIKTKKIVGGGTPVPKVEYTYHSLTGAPVTQRFVCEASCEGFDDQRTLTSYDTLGRVTSYADADGNVATTTYDLLGRVATTSDGKGSQTRVYDSVTGLLTELQDSAAGTFTASYDADGRVVEQGLPNGLMAKTTFNEVGESVGLVYQKESMCSTACTWLEFEAERSIYGQVLGQSSFLSSQDYDYDKAGRLVLVKDRPTGGACTTRAYSYDDNSNRTALTVRAPGIGGACDTTSAGSTQTYQYDSGDRFIATGIVYDEFGRITSLPSGVAGEGKALSTSYFSTNMVASQAQGGVTNTYQLDGALRHRQRLQGGGLEGAEIFHYASSWDRPAWTERGGTWTRYVEGVTGELAAVQVGASDVSLQLSNLHGDVIATASVNPAQTKPTATFEFDEFGIPRSTSTPRMGWLGGKQRRTELKSGVVQMGVRSYVPALGRFLSPDPIQGGSANAYEYAGGDPVNGFDLTGEAMCTYRRVCGKGAGYGAAIRRDRRAARRANRAGVLAIRGPVATGLLARPDLVNEMQEKIGRLEAADIRRFREAAYRELQSPPSNSGAAILCEDIERATTYTRAFGVVSGILPGGQAFAAIVGGGSELAKSGVDIARDQDWC